MVRSFSDVIDAFGGPAAYAREVGMTPGAAKQAKRRQSLSAKWFAPTAAAATRLGLTGLGLGALADIAARQAGHPSANSNHRDMAA